jgi:hypothetical protein
MSDQAHRETLKVSDSEIIVVTLPKTFSAGTKLKVWATTGEILSATVEKEIPLVSVPRKSRKPVDSPAVILPKADTVNESATADSEKESSTATKNGRK